jgi:GTP pyrophosphokinase
MLRQYELVERVLAYDPDADEAILNRAYVYTVQKHGTQKRASGDPYFSHPVEVAGLMTELKLDQATVMTALLHDTVEDTLATVDEIERLFGADVARLVDGVTKLSKIETMSDNERAAENLRKFLLAMSEDLRVLLVKLADRLHNMRTLHFIKSEESAAASRARRWISMPRWPSAWACTNTCARCSCWPSSSSNPKPMPRSGVWPRSAARRTGRSGRSRRSDQALAEAGLRVEVSGREKHPYSIWKKMAERHVSFEQITDIMAFRVLTENEDDCYKALGILHRTWQMIPGRFKDYISTPKMNGYKSLHTSLIYNNAMRVEVQIKTRAMHETNESAWPRTGPTSRAGLRPTGRWAGCAICWKSSKPATIPRNCSKTPRWRSIRIASSLHAQGRCSSCPRARRRSTSLLPFTPIWARRRWAPDQRAARAAAHAAEQRRCGGDHQEPYLGAAAFVAGLRRSKARASIRRFVRQKERAEVAAIGRKLYEEIVERLPGTGKKALAAIKRLKMAGEEDLMFAIGSAKVDDRQVMEALMPGSAANLPDPDHWPKQKRAIAVRG